MNHLINAGTCTMAIVVLTACNLNYAPSENFDHELGVQNQALKIVTITPTPDPNI